MKKIALLLYTVIVLVLAASCDRRAEYLTASGAMLGTTFQATGDITDCTAQELYRAIMQIDAEAKASMSIFDSTSLLSRINRGETDSLDEHIIYNLRLAERFSRLSEGHYDVTGKICPKYYVENEDAWLAFRQNVSARIEEDNAANGETN